MRALLARVLHSRVGAWRYERSTEASGRRDLRIDLLRGFCVFVMIVDHVGGESSWLYVLTGGNRFVVSAAEGFVLLSGLSMGMVHHVVVHRDGYRAMLEKIFGRARLLYVLTVILTILFAAVSNVLSVPWAEGMTPAKGRVDFVASVITFHRAYSLTDILVLYTLLVITAGPALWLIARGRSGLVLAASVTVWTVAQLWPERIPRVWQITDGGFPFSAWQLMFMIGLVVGFNRNKLERYLSPARLIAFGVAAVIALYTVQLVTKWFVGHANVSLDVHELLFDKNSAHVGRILALFAATSFMFAAATLLWVPLRRATAWLLLPMGRNALFAYAVQLFVVAFLSSELMAPVRLDRENALFQAAAVGAVWLGCLGQPALNERWRRVRSWRTRPLTAPAS